MQKQTRDKKTAIENTLAPVAQLIDGKPDFVPYINLDGESCKLHFKPLVDKDPYPNPMPIDREGYGDVETTFRYWAIGHTDWLNVETAVSRYLKHSGSNKIKSLDFGAATGRVLRHAWAFGRDRYEIWGCDFAPANVAWVKKHLSSDINFFLNTNHPELPFEDDQLDVVTAFSVFTHIDELEEDWLLELKRVTRAGGLLYITVHKQRFVASYSRLCWTQGTLFTISQF